MDLGHRLLLGVVAGRMLIETRRSFGATIPLALSSTTLIAGPWLAVWLVPTQDAERSVMLICGLRMLGHLLLLSGVAIYARHVILDAEGRLKQRSPKSESKPKAKRRAKVESEADEASDKKPASTASEPNDKPRVAAHSRSDLESSKLAARPSVAVRPAVAARSEAASRSEGHSCADAPDASRPSRSPPLAANRKTTMTTTPATAADSLAPSVRSSSANCGKPPEICHWRRTSSRKSAPEYLVTRE